LNLEQKEKEEFFLSEEPKLPNINHPEYYTKGRIETWDFIKDKGLNFATLALSYLFVPAILF